MKFIVLSLLSSFAFAQNPSNMRGGQSVNMPKSNQRLIIKNRALQGSRGIRKGLVRQRRRPVVVEMPKLDHRRNNDLHYGIEDFPQIEGSPGSYGSTTGSYGTINDGHYPQRPDVQVDGSGYAGPQSYGGGMQDVRVLPSREPASYRGAKGAQ